MRIYDKTWLKTSVAEAMKRAARSGTYDGRMAYESRLYFERCRAYHEPTGTRLIFTRDVGHHASGWWKNPDYERCYHLSLSFLDPANHAWPVPRDRGLTREWVDCFFGADSRKLWCEPPYSPEGKALDVWHYRLFCAPDWSPIVPRKEVYSREFTEAGWKSYSDVQAELVEARELARERSED